MAQVDTVLNDFILNVLSEEEFQNLAEKDGNQLYFTDLIEYYTKEEARALMTLFRGQFANWESVPTSIADYASDFVGSKTPTQNNIMVVKDASGYATDVCDILSHVQSTGTQYINLGIIPTVGMKYVVNFQASDSTIGTIFGTDSCDMHVYQGENNPVTEINIGTATELNGIGVSSGFNINYELTIKASSVTSKASNVTISNPYKGTLPATEMYMLAKNTADVATDFSACIVKGFKVYEDETLLMDLVPARRVLDGAIGFVDIMTNVFYENLGADPLIAGDIVSAAETPDDTSGSWLFIYNGKWNEKGKTGWTPACALGGSMPDRYVAAINGYTGEVFLGCREIGTYTSEEIDAKIDVASPAGMVSAFACTTAPSGWLKCDGSAVSRTTYAALFAAIGTKYGSGNGSTTFNLPTQSVLPLGTSAPVSLTANGTLQIKNSSSGLENVVKSASGDNSGRRQLVVNADGNGQNAVVQYGSGITGTADLANATGTTAIVCIKY